MLTKPDISRTLYEKSNKKIPIKDLDLIVDDIFNIILENLQNGEEVQISGFGSFVLTEKLIRPVVKIKKIINTKK